MLKRAQAGLTLVELLVTMAIAMALLAWGAPNFTVWISNSRVRSTAESMLSGLQIAKAEAVSRNALTRFQLTTTLTDTCSISTSGPNWVVNADPNPGTVVGNCDKSDPDSAPFVIRRHDSSSSQGVTAVASTTSTIVFNGLGRVTPLPAGNQTIDVTPPNTDNCAAAGGTMTCLRIVVSPAGQIRMCNPKFNAPDPQACP